MIYITPAKPSDSEAIRALEAKVHGEEVTTRYDAALISRFGYAYLVKENSQIIGAITAWQTKDGEVKINDWVVHPEHRRKGIGEIVKKETFCFNVNFGLLPLFSPDSTLIEETACSTSGSRS